MKCPQVPPLPAHMHIPHTYIQSIHAVVKPLLSTALCSSLILAVSCRRRGRTVVLGSCFLRSPTGRTAAHPQCRNVRRPHRDCIHGGGVSRCCEVAWWIIVFCDAVAPTGGWSCVRSQFAIRCPYFLPSPLHACPSPLHACIHTCIHASTQVPAYPST